jgi:methionyl aminopeptidase
MNITINSAEAIAGMRVAGRLGAEVLDFITPHVRPGVTTEYLDQLCYDYIVNEQQAWPAPLNYQPEGHTAYPKSICTSVNHQVCHGIPSARVLKDGDMLNIDVTVIKDRYHGDTSRMFFVGKKPNVQGKLLSDVTYVSMWKGIEQVKAGATAGDIGYAIQKYAESHGFSVVRDFCGHGINTVFHEEPQILHYGKRGEGTVLQAGMIFTIEPMLNAGRKEVKMLADGWTAVTKDHSLSAQWEHTILVTETGYEIMTLSAGSPPPPDFVSQP